MVSFTAWTPQNMRHLGELRAIGSDNADARYANMEVSYIRDVHGHKIVVDLGGSFTYDGGVPSGGAVESVTVTIDGKPAYGFEGIGLGILPFIEQASLYRSDPIGTLAKLFAGDDDLAGSRKGDLLIGFAGDDSLEGRRGGDKLLGGKGKDVIDGGRGKDIMKGGADGDSFVFSTSPDAKHVDVIRDFDPGVDALLYEWDPYNTIVPADPATPQLVTPDQVHVGRHATTAAHRFIYDPRTGVLSYDPDGKGGAGQTPVVKLAGAPALDYAEHPFMFVI
ncbi:MAG: hypothetical protein KDJ86_13960 [Bauldia sp.]|uniref:hypothetical protein n=1 Tax=Bauldia sp. TaxID=2575872 RepID=UPI001D1B9405|nr:hypothetical protein [Bauldia sp.]MCB1496889.1 hypothetical protein [Bauldia sp.]